METIESAKYNGYAATDSENAFRILFDNKYHTCIIFDTNNIVVDNIIKEVLRKLKSHNATISNINDQMLPSVYRWIAQDDDGNNCYYAAEISMDRFEKKAQLLHMFNEPVYWVLTDPNARKPMTSKAMKTLVMLTYNMMTKNKE